VQPFLAKGLVIEHAHTYRLSEAGKFMADYIAAELFSVEE
jgi:hypothetical protein